MTMITPYTAVAVQTVIRHVKDPAWRDEIVRENVNRSLSLMDYVSHRFGAAKLFVLPEFSLTGAEHLRTVDEWTKVALQIPGPELDPLAQFARDNDAYVGGGTMEYDPNYPGRWFNSAYLFGPTGELLIRYRKINGADVQGHTTYSTPPALYDLYVKTEGGEDALFPVVDTPIGRLGVINCYDINFPEMVRTFALHGAEVLLHVTGEPYSPHRDIWEMSRRTRAFENIMYIISANHGGYVAQIAGDTFADAPGLNFQQRMEGEIAPLQRSHGGSKIVDFNGNVVGQSQSPGEALALGSIDIEALRERRAEINGNILAQVRSELYAKEYARHRASPLNRWLDHPIQDRSEGSLNTREVIERYIRNGVYVAPEGYEFQTEEDESADRRATA
ncbi:MAG: nitrilase-related carbon-nitrogen hydrolase [Rhodospirillales bacterium]|jgi:predicted amidohydrolase